MEKASEPYRISYIIKNLVVKPLSLISGIGLIAYGIKENNIECAIGGLAFIYAGSDKSGLTYRESHDLNKIASSLEEISKKSAIH